MQSSSDAAFRKSQIEEWRGSMVSLQTRPSVNVQIKRVYEEPSTSDGKRILIDRLWPRGLTKGKAKVDLWLKDIAPSTELRQWFGHDPSKWKEFKKRYHDELKKNREIIVKLIEQLKTGKVTLVYGAKDEEHNDAVVLKEYLEKK